MNRYDPAKYAKTSAERNEILRKEHDLNALFLDALRDFLGLEPMPGMHRNGRASEVLVTEESRPPL